MASRRTMIRELKRQGFKTLRIKHGTWQHKKYGDLVRLSLCPNLQITAVYNVLMKIKREEHEKQLKWDFINNVRDGV